MDLREAWEVLGLDPSADADAIRAAYRALLKKHKPEIDPTGFRRLRDAYEHVNAHVGQRDATGLRTPTNEARADEHEEPDVVALRTIFATFDSTAPDDYAARLAISRDAMRRFPAFHEPRALFDEALESLQDPKAAEEELVRAYWDEIPGAAEVLLRRAPHRLMRSDLVRLGETGSDFDRAIVALALARNGGVAEASDLAITLLDPGRDSPLEPQARALVIEVGIELFAAREPVLASYLAQALLEEETRIAVGRRIPNPRGVYLRELCGLGDHAPPIGLADLALVLTDPNVHRVARRSNGDEDSRLGHALQRSPMLSRIWMNRPMAALGTPPRRIDTATGGTPAGRPYVQTRRSSSGPPVEAVLGFLALAAVGYVLFAIVSAKSASDHDRASSPTGDALIVATHEAELTRILQDPFVNPCVAGLMVSGRIPPSAFSAPESACREAVVFAGLLGDPQRCAEAKSQATRTLRLAPGTADGERRFRDYVVLALGRSCPAEAESFQGR